MSLFTHIIIVNGKTIKKCTVCKGVESTTTIYAAKTVKLAKNAFVYNGKAIKPSVVIKDSKGKVIPVSNYTIGGT